MTTTQQLGGTRQSYALENEMTYPLTNDEYLVIKDNLSIDKFTNWESFLLTTGISSLISGIIIYISGTFEQHITVEGKDVIKINMLQVSLIVIYGALTIGALLGFFISRSAKKTSEKPIHRLDAKITSHLNKVN